MIKPNDDFFYNFVAFDASNMFESFKSNPTYLSTYEPVLEFIHDKDSVGLQDIYKFNFNDEFKSGLIKIEDQPKNLILSDNKYATKYKYTLNTFIFKYDDKVKVILIVDPYTITVEQNKVLLEEGRSNDEILNWLNENIVEKMPDEFKDKSSTQPKEKNCLNESIASATLGTALGAAVGVIAAKNM